MTLNTVISGDALVAALQMRGVESYVEQTGGGTATLYVSPTRTDEQGDTRYTAVAGPGRFDGPGWTAPLFDLTDFAVGPDDDGEGGYVDPVNFGILAVEDVAVLIAAQAKKMTAALTADEVRALGFAGEKPAVLIAADVLGKAACDVSNRMNAYLAETGVAPSDRYPQNAAYRQRFLDAVALGKSEIREILTDGVTTSRGYETPRLGVEIKSFADLHDVCDANTLAGICDENDKAAGSVGHPGATKEEQNDAWLTFGNDVQDALDAWIKAGCPADEEEK